jgi:DNA-binding SARP family transcriptional activator/outer membrane protein assembly factor BamB
MAPPEATAAATVRLRLLGPLAVEVDGQRAELSGTRQRALLALLGLHANEAVATERLLDLLWDGEPPPTARASLRVAVMKLRRFLEDEASGVAELETLPAAYRLRIDPDAVDITVFAELAEAGRRALEAGDAREARRRFADALALCGDISRADLPSTDAASLEERRLVTLEDRIDADLAAGVDRVLVPELQRLVEEHPLRERFRMQLMLALYRSGRQQEALDAYRSAREYLDAELGLAPSPELQRLERLILEQDATLERPLSSAVRAALRWPRRVRVVAGSIALAAVAAGVVVATLGSASGRGLASVGANSAAALDPASARVTAVLHLGARPEAIAVADGVLWAANFDDQTVERVDLRTHAVHTIGTDGAVTSIAVGAGGLWLGERSGGEVIRLDPTTGQVLARIRVGAGTVGIATGFGSVWVSSESAGTVDRIDPADDRVVARLRLRGPAGIAVAPSGIWVAESFGRSLAEIDPRSNTVAVRIPLDLAPDALAYANGDLWATHPLDNAVTRITLASRATTLVSVGRAPLVVTAAGRWAWVVNDIDHSVYRIDAATAQVDKRVVLAPLSAIGAKAVTPGGIVATSTAVWVTLQRF